MGSAITRGNDPVARLDGEAVVLKRTRKRTVSSDCFANMIDEWKERAPFVFANDFSGGIEHGHFYFGASAIDAPKKCFGSLLCFHKVSKNASMIVADCSSE